MLDRFGFQESCWPHVEQYLPPFWFGRTLNTLISHAIYLVICTICWLAYRYRKLVSNALQKWRLGTPGGIPKLIQNRIENGMNKLSEKSSQNLVRMNQKCCKNGARHASKNQCVFWCVFDQKKLQKWSKHDPNLRAQGGPTNQLFAHWTPVGGTLAPKGSYREPKRPKMHLKTIQNRRK